MWFGVSSRVARASRIGGVELRLSRVDEFGLWIQLQLSESSDMLIDSSTWPADELSEVRLQIEYEWMLSQAIERWRRRSSVAKAGVSQLSMGSSWKVAKT